MSLFHQRKTKLEEYYRKFRTIPSYEELTAFFSLKSKGSLHKYIQKFIEAGYLIKKENGKLCPAKKLIGIRLLGDIKAGFPSPAEEELVDTISLDEYLIGNPDATYLLKVKGDSMAEAGILEGDLALVDRSQSPKSGDVVVAEIDHEWTIKYFIKENGKTFLRPANKKYHDIHPKEELKIAGIVISVVRKY